MTCDFTTLLPHPTGVELALEQDAAEKYCRADPAVIRTLFDPMECPAELLPWLAYALSVDVWNPKWPESTKRAVCGNSLQMHLHKGTLGGVEDALEALGIRVEIVEWWQAEPVAKVGTMQVTLWVNQVILPDADIILGADRVRDVKEQLDRSKRASIHYTYRLAVESSPNGVGTASSGQVTTHQRTDALHRTTAIRATAPTGVGIASSGQVTTHQRTDALHRSTALRATAPASVGMASSGQVTTHQRTDALHRSTATRATAYFPVRAWGGSGQLTTHLRLEASL